MPQEKQKRPELELFRDIRLEMSGNGKKADISLHGISEIVEFSNTKISAEGKNRKISIGGSFLQIKTVGDGDFVISGKVEEIRFEIR